jgi:hypothetical protein
LVTVVDLSGNIIPHFIHFIIDFIRL